MNKFAVIKDGKVLNTIVADTKEIAEEISGYPCIQYEYPTAVGPYWEWDGINFIPPAAEAIIEGEIVPPAIEG